MTSPIILLIFLLLELSLKHSLKMFPFTNEFAFFCILKCASFLSLVLQIKHNIF